MPRSSARVRTSSTASPVSIHGATALLGAAALTSAHGGTAAHDTDNDTFPRPSSATTRTARSSIWCFSRDQVTLSSYESEDIRTKVETWADTVAALA